MEIDADANQTRCACRTRTNSAIAESRAVTEIYAILDDILSARRGRILNLPCFRVHGADPQELSVPLRAMVLQVRLYFECAGAIYFAQMRAYFRAFLRSAVPSCTSWL